MNRSENFRGVVLSFVCVLAVLGLLLPSVARGATTVRMLDSVEVGEEQILLGDIARIKGDDRNLVERLEGIVVGKAPLPRSCRTIDEDYVKIRLKQHGIEDDAVRLAGSREVKVTRGVVEIDEEGVRDIVSRFISVTDPWKNARFRIVEIAVDRGVVLPKGRITHTIVKPDRTSIAGKIPLSVVFEVDGRVAKKVWVTADVEVYADVAVTIRPLPRYQVITEDDVAVEQRNLASAASNSLTRLDEVCGKRTKRSLNAGVILRDDLLESLPLVKRGDRVFIVAESKGLRITTRGEAREKGGMGDTVRVINLDSRKGILARVIDENTVRVDF